MVQEVHYMDKPPAEPADATPGPQPGDPGRPGRWTFLTSHAHALIVIARDPDVRLREVAATLGVTERTAHAVVNDLVEAGYLVRARVGNRNRYSVNSDLPFRHPVERDHAVGELLGVLASAED